MDDKGIMPLTMIRNKPQIGCCLCPVSSATSTESLLDKQGYRDPQLFAHPVGIIVLYYLPLYYQSAEEHSALRSGVDMLVFMASSEPRTSHHQAHQTFFIVKISMAVGVICAGFITGKVRYS